MSATSPVLQTARLRLDELTDDDADFVVELLNDPDFLLHIGDKQVRDITGARRYLAEGPRASYAAHGFGLWKATLLATGAGAGWRGKRRKPSSRMRSARCAGHACWRSSARAIPPRSSCWSASA